MKNVRRRKGKRPGPAAVVTAPRLSAAELARKLGCGLLVPPSWLFACYRRLEARCYARGLCHACDPGRPAVAVGGLTADGRGRVLLTSWLLGWAEARGIRTAVTVPRGDASPPALPFVVPPDGDPWESGMEAALLARYTQGGHILMDTDPVRGVRDAVGRYDPDLLVLQDAVADPRVRRDMTLAILTPDDLGSGWNRTLPAGGWRTDASALARASAFCIFAGQEHLPAAMATAKRRLGHFGRPVFGLSFAIWRFRGPAGEATAAELGESPYVVVLDEADREVVPDMLRQQLGTAPRLAFFVHERHRFTRQDFEHLYADATRLRVPNILTSPRLALKLRSGGDTLAGLSVWTYDPEVLFGPSLLTAVPFLAWWEAAFAAVTEGRQVP